MKGLLVTALAALLAVGCAGNQTPASPTLDEVFASRRSIRAYEAGKTISEAEVRELLTATQNAPSWANQQPSKYYVAIGAEKREAVLELIGGNKERVINAPVFIVSTFEKGKSGFFRGRPSTAPPTTGAPMTTASATPIWSSRPAPWASTP